MTNVEGISASKHSRCSFDQVPTITWEDELNPLFQNENWVLLKMSVVGVVIVSLKRNKNIMLGLVFGMCAVVLWNLIQVILYNSC